MQVGLVPIRKPDKARYVIPVFDDNQNTGILLKFGTALLLILLLSFQSTAQETTTDQDPFDVLFNDILIPLGFINYTMEHYRTDANNSYIEHHFFYQPLVSKESVINIEGGITNSFLETGNFTTPADFSVTYQHNFPSSRYQQSGWQGYAPAMKFVIPTGFAEYSSGLDSWIIEPLVATQWLLKNTDWFFSFQGRYNYPIAAIPGSTKSRDYLRLEAFFGMENRRMWAFVQPDYRYTPSLENHTIFVNFDLGYKISDRFGVQASVKPRVSGDRFFEQQTVIGAYLYFERGLPEK